MQNYLNNHYQLYGGKLYAEVVDIMGVVYELTVTDMVLSDLDVTDEKIKFPGTMGSHFKLAIYWESNLKLGCLPNDLQPGNFEVTLSAGKIYFK